MPSRTFQEQMIIRQTISEYLEANGMTSLRKIAAFIKEEVDYQVSPSTIARLVRDEGYEIGVETQWYKK